MYMQPIDRRGQRHAVYIHLMPRIKSVIKIDIKTVLFVVLLRLFSMKLFTSSALFLTATVASALASTPSSFEARAPSSSPNADNGANLPAHASENNSTEPTASCPEGMEKVELLLSPCYLVCKDPANQKPEQIIQKPEGAKCGRHLFWIMRCTASGFCTLT